MEEKRLPNAALHEHVDGNRSRWRQRKICMDNVREDLKEKHIDLTRIGETTRNREVWRSLLRACRLHDDGGEKKRGIQNRKQYKL